MLIINPIKISKKVNFSRFLDFIEAPDKRIYNGNRRANYAFEGQSKSEVPIIL